MAYGQDDLQAVCLAVGLVEGFELLAQGARGDADDGVGVGIKAGELAAKRFGGDGLLADIASGAFKVFVADEGEEADEIVGAAELRLREYPLQLCSFG